MKYEYRIIITFMGKRREGKWMQDLEQLAQDCKTFVKNGCDFQVETREMQP